MLYKLNPALNDTYVAGVINKMSAYDKLISDETHKIDSILSASNKNIPLNEITIQNLKSKKDRAYNYFYFTLILLIICALFLIIFSEKIKNYKKEVTFLESDIKEANSNYSKVSDEKHALQRETSIKIKSLNDKIHLINNEKDFLIEENNKLKKSIKELENEITIIKDKLKVSGNEENKYLREAVKLLEKDKNELLDEIEKIKKEKVVSNKNSTEDVEQIKIELAKRIDHLENALKAKEIMESVIVNKHKEYEETIKNLKETIEQLTVELEDEKAYNDKLNNKISFFEDELAEKENELKNMWAKLTSQSQINMSKSENDPNYNILKTIEKLNRLKQADILSDNEFETLKDKIINQI
jgi:chromosome segregation ATPase